MMAFDMTYITETLTQMALSDVPEMVGGVYLPESPEHCFIRLDREDGDIDVKKIKKACQILETVVWDPIAPKKIPLSICSLPVLTSFDGELSGYRASLYLMNVIGQILDQCNGLVKGISFDAAGSHLLLRNVLQGIECGIAPLDLAALPWFSQLRYRPLPPHGLPRLPGMLAFHCNEVVWAVPGVCHLSSLWNFVDQNDSFKKL